MSPRPFSEVVLKRSEERAALIRDAYRNGNRSDARRLLLTGTRAEAVAVALLCALWYAENLQRNAALAVVSELASDMLYEAGAGRVAL